MFIICYTLYSNSIFISYQHKKAYSSQFIWFIHIQVYKIKITPLKAKFEAFFNNLNKELFIFIINFFYFFVLLKNELFLNIYNLKIIKMIFL